HRRRLAKQPDRRPHALELQPVTAPATRLPMNGGGIQSIIEGPVGALVELTAAGGAWSNIVNTDLGGGLYEIAADFAPAASQNDWRFGVAPRSTVAGEYVDVLGAMVVEGSGPAEWIFGDPASSFTRAAETLTLHLPPGQHDLQITFGGGAGQTI